MKVYDETGQLIQGKIFQAPEGSTVLVFPPGKEVEIFLPTENKKYMYSSSVFIALALQTLLNEDDEELMNLIIDKNLDLIKNNERGSE